MQKVEVEVPNSQEAKGIPVGECGVPSDIKPPRANSLPGIINVKCPMSLESAPNAGALLRTSFRADSMLPNMESLQLEQLETKEIKTVKLSETADKGRPRHAVGCTRHECHGAMMEKRGFDAISNSYALDEKAKIHEARDFLRQYAAETGLLDEDDLVERERDVVTDIQNFGSYQQTEEELEFGVRLAWRNSGRCIMRKVAFTLELRDCRGVTTADACFHECVRHLQEAANGGSIKPVITIFPQKKDGQSAPVRIWNRQLLGYAAYHRQDGTTMGDPVNLSFTALCVELGWQPPMEKSDFDILPLVISDEQGGHDNPMWFELPYEAVLEVPIVHPEFDLFQELNLRWYGIPAISNMAVDVGGIVYQCCPFNGWYAVTEIGRDFLDKQRYDLAEAVAVACDIPMTKKNIWRDDAQLQMHRAIIHSFAEASVSVVDHHTASASFADFYQDEIKSRRKCPADWVWLVPPAGGSMTSVFHQEMTNFIIKPQYRPFVDLCEEEGLEMPEPIVADVPGRALSSLTIVEESMVYKDVRLYYGSETGTAVRFATRLSSDLMDLSFGPYPLDELPSFLKGQIKEPTLILIVTSTFGRGQAPKDAHKFLPGMQTLQLDPSTSENCCFAVFALGNSAYTMGFASFGIAVHKAMESSGARPALPIHFADELKNQERSYEDWKEELLDGTRGVIYNEVSTEVKESGATETKESHSDDDMVKLTFEGFAQVIRSDTKKQLENLLTEANINQSWSSYSNKLGRSADLFSFKVSPEHQERLKDYEPGDNIALYPKNLKDTVEIVARLMERDSTEGIEAIKENLRCNVDLAKPLTSDALEELRLMTNNDQARFMIGVMIRQSSKEGIGLSSESLINRLPPGSIPCEWLLTCAPKIEPRFFSIASLCLKEGSVSICQSVFNFDSTGQAGTTSRWLRSMHAGEPAYGLFSHTDFHLPADRDAPVLLIGTGTGIAPFRSFWVSRARNPMYLFFGCRNRQELPFASEITALSRIGSIHPFIAYSREIADKMYVQDLISRESSTVLSLLHNPKTHVYICGAPAMEYAVRNEFLMALCAGDETHAGMKISRAVEKIVLMKQQKRFVTEIYGTLANSGRDATEILWKESTTKIVKSLSSLEKLILPRAREAVVFRPIATNTGNSWSSAFRPEYESDKPKSKTLSRLKARKRDIEISRLNLSRSAVPVATESESTASPTDEAPDSSQGSHFFESSPKRSGETDEASLHVEEISSPFNPMRVKTKNTSSWHASFCPQESRSDVFEKGNSDGTSKRKASRRASVS